MEKITIFTPTYNRGYCLPRIYNSLVNQSNKNFVWLIVDDGSTDNTGEIVEKWIKENLIDIEYYKQENQGKMQAYNKGLINCKTELFLCLDSDDWLNINTVEEILKVYNKIKDNDKCVGILSYKVYKNFTIVGGKEFPKNVQYTTLMRLYDKYKFKGDTMLIFKSQIAKKYMFPKIEKEKFIPETYVYDQIDQDGELYILDKKMYFCEYLEDGYSKNAKNIIKNNPKGYLVYAKNRMDLSNNLKQKYKAAAQYVLGNWLDNRKIKIFNEKNKFIILSAIPAAYIIYLKFYKRMG